MKINQYICALYVFFSELIAFTKNKYNRLEITIAIKKLKLTKSSIEIVYIWKYNVLF